MPSTQRLVRVLAISAFLCIPGQLRAQLRDAASAITARDYGSAERAIENQVQAHPADALSHCLLGELQRERSEYDAALASFERCEQVARRIGAAARLDQLRGMTGKAMTLELIPDRLDEARSAWVAIVRFSEGSGGAVDGAVARTRLQAIDNRMAGAATARSVLERRTAPTP